MTIRIVSIEGSLMVEIPEALAQQARLDEGQAVKWIAAGGHGLVLVKKTTADGLLEIESEISRINAHEEQLLETKRRAEQGDVNAQQFLGMISEDKREAMRWLQLAAEQEDKLSMRLLGHILVLGDGIDKNLAEGYFWLLLSASTYSLKSTRQERAQMHQECRELQCIEEGLTEQERKRIEDRCQVWLNTHNLTKCFKPKFPGAPSFTQSHRVKGGRLNL
jgi:antitoxin component of MazEF toxin-antitoxin module